MQNNSFIFLKIYNFQILSLLTFPFLFIDKNEIIDMFILLNFRIETGLLNCTNCLCLLTLYFPIYKTKWKMSLV